MKLLRISFTILAIVLAGCQGSQAQVPQSTGWLTAPASPTVPPLYPAITLPAGYPAPSVGSPAIGIYPNPATPAPALPLPPSPAPSQNPRTATPGQLAPQAASSPQPPSRIYTCELPETALPVYTFDVVAVYPHDPNAYTQGLILRSASLYESTGLRGRSSLRQVDLETGTVLRQVDIPEPYFAEGLAELEGRLYQLTWQEKTGFIYNLENFEKLGEFSYPVDGWGLTTDGNLLLLSDGSDRVFLLDPTTHEIGGEIRVHDGLNPVTSINEMEFIDGEVFANIYQTACIVRFDPTSGQVTGWIDLSGLHERALQASVPGISAPEVPNGIAFDPAGRRLLVTGKFWPELYAITIRPQEQP